MLRWLVFSLVAVALVLSGPARIARAAMGAGPQEPCPAHGDAMPVDHAGHHSHDDAKGDAKSGAKGSVQACCHSHSPSQLNAGPVALPERIALLHSIAPRLARLLVGLSAPPDTPPPRL